MCISIIILDTVANAECLVKNCANCGSSESVCKECLAGFSLSDTQQCGLLCHSIPYTCVSDTVSLLSIEMDCLVRNCSTCSTNSNICANCSAGYKLVDGQCSKFSMPSHVCYFSWFCLCVRVFVKF